MSHEELKAENIALKAELAELKTDLKTAIKAVFETCKDLGIDTTGGKKQSLFSVLPGLTTKLMTGQLKFDKIEAITPMLAKYKHLIED